MAEERLNLIDGMTPALRRIYEAAERLNRRILALKSNINTMHKPGALSYFKNELKSVENQAKQTQQSVQRMRVAFNQASKSGNFWFGLNGKGSLFITHGTQDRRQWTKLQGGQINGAMLSWLGNHESGIARREAMLRANRFRELRNSPIWGNYARLDMRMSRFGHRLSGVAEKFGGLRSSSGSLINRIVGVTSSLMLFGYALNRIADVAKTLFINPQSQYISNLTRVALTNDSKKTPDEMVNELYDTANRTRAPIDATMALYNRVALSGVKADNERIRRFVESFNKVTAISGTTGQENRAVMLQLAQGIGSNRLGGDEFRSISEQAPVFKKMLAEGMGVNPGALKQMGAEGKLTAEAILSAMEKMQDKIDEIFEYAPWTLEQTVTILQNKWNKMIKDQLSGYIAIRDLIRDITRWMDTPKGQETIKKIINAWNSFMIGVTQFIRKIAPMVIWIIDHLKGISTLLKIILVIFALWKVAIASIKLVMFIRTAIDAFNALKLVMTSSMIAFGATAAAVLGWILAIVAALTVAWKVGNWIANNLKEKREMEAVNVHEDMLAQNKQQAWEAYASNKMREQGLTPHKSQVGGGIGTKEASYWNSSKGYREERLKWEKEYWAPREAQFRKSHDQWLKDSELGQYKLTEREEWDKYAKNELSMLDKLKGMEDSSANVPMVGKVKEVGKVNDKISIDTEDIEMMKSIAERQWTMQNEVTVPQNVNMTITKEVDMDEEVLAQRMTNSMRTAVASSMRGKVE